MAAGTKSDFQIYHEQFFGGWTEVLMQNTMAFNAASRSGIRLTSARKKGDFEQESFLKEISGIVSRRDITSVSAAADTKIEQGEEKRVKLNAKIGPIAQTLDAWRKISSNERVMSLLIGRQAAVGGQNYMLNRTLIGLDAALSGVATVNKSATGSTMTHTVLSQGLELFGDAAEKIVCWIMHSHVYFDLQQQALSDKITNVADVVINQGWVGSLNRPVVVTDSSALVTSGSPDTYATIGVVADGANVVESEESDIVAEKVTGYENILYRIQGEFAFNLGVKGFQWGSTVNPNDAALGTSGNWTQVAADTKSLAGIRITTQ